ncbi:ABC transporter substrate-binding protein [Symbioplanes lichenis]|uniref:ABC transporter substrate-binding protein n=1 Tax=Symbioplanes lichenis TaxID=1629072 RepID=UPI00273884B9|nr:ABC transporter substrate-binding protein [Actinoplanes lichenis]
MTALLTLSVLTLTACGDSSTEETGDGPPEIAALSTLGAGEGQVDVVSWAGYVEDGSTDKTVDWVTGFERETGCQVANKVAATSDEMVTLMKTGDYDVVSASGDASLRLIYGGDVAPVNTDLVPHYKDVFDGLKAKPWNSVGGKPYGIPHGRGANVLMYRTDVVKPAPTSWGAVFDPASPHQGKITAYDSPISIADAALYLMKTKPDLNIKNPYALDDKQFQAAVDLLKQQNETIGEYWSDYTKEVQAFKAGNSVLGTSWQVIVNLAQADKAPVAAVLPTEGATGWSDTWMVAAKAKHPNCAYQWMNHIVSPEANAAVAEWFGEAPANKLACAKTTDKNHCATFHAEDEAYFDQVWFWTTPLARCVDGRTDVQCKDYAAWTQAWTTIKG